ncbi:MAG: NAD(P)-dependent alcohol dehydrogenase, partial [Chitinophagales bacterium]|nr:NAD(P)-dependent alcohol dehydrogenase [Chitinophagales bacterium]
MKAAIYNHYGPPDVVSIQEMDKPIPKEDEILIKVIASTVNRTDTGLRSAQYFISRFFTGLFKPKYKVLGNEFAGVIEQIGSSVSSFKIGDRIFGFNDTHFGGHAEYMIVREADAIATIPDTISFIEAACITEGAHYALVDIRAAKVQSRQNVMVYGATGAIGSAAVQLLKHFGAHVTAVCNTKNVDLVKSLGADVVIDYMQEDFTQTQQKFDFVFDAVGKTSFGKCKPILTKKGIYISTELG